MVEQLSLSSADIEHITSRDNNDIETVALNSVCHTRIFFSFDIVNSTQFKDLNRNNWAKIIKQLLEMIRVQWNSADKNADFWKTIGDEIVFTKTITNFIQIYETLENIHITLKDINKRLADNKLFSNECDVNADQLDKLSLKAAAWIADISDNESEAANIVTKYQVMKNYNLIEYIGPDIDAGFRISKYSDKGRLVVSFELACMVIDNIDMLANHVGKASSGNIGSFATPKSLDKRLYIVSFQKLKGIWNNRAYPIIWYHNSDTNLMESFEYDQYSTNSNVYEYNKNIRGENEFFPDSKIFSDTKYGISKIRNDLSWINPKIEKLNSYVQESIILKNDVDQLELHFAAVCYKISSGIPEIFIVKRKRTPKSKWEFGCIKADIACKLVDTIEKEYESTFGLKIQVIKDNARSEKKPLPIALYQMDNLSKIGVIVVAKILNDENIKITSKFDEHKYISESIADDFINNNSEMLIDDFSDTLKKCFKIIKTEEETSN